MWFNKITLSGVRVTEEKRAVRSAFIFLYETYELFGFSLTPIQSSILVTNDFLFILLVSVSLADPKL